jgi:hypothetical protein
MTAYRAKLARLGMWWYVSIVIVIVMGVIFLGCRTDLWVDYDSGATRKVITVWGVTVVDRQLPPSPFAVLRLSNGLAGLTGKPDWHLVRSFIMTKQDLYQSETELTLLTYISMCGWELQIRTQPEAVQLKEDFLHALSTGGPIAAYHVLDEAWKLRGKNSQ